MAIQLEPDTGFTTDDKPTIASGDVQNGALAEAILLTQADTWQVQLMYAGPANVSMVVDDVLETYREVSFCKPSFVDRVLFGVIATGSGDVTIKSTVVSTDYEQVIAVQNALEDSTADAALSGASLYSQTQENASPFDDSTSPSITPFEIKRGPDVRVFGIVLKFYRSNAGL